MTNDDLQFALYVLISGLAGGVIGGAIVVWLDRRRRP